MSEHKQDRKLNPKPRSGFQGWMIGGLIALVVVFTLVSRDSGMVETTSRQFEKMVLANDVQEVILIDEKDYIEVDPQA